MTLSREMPVGKCRLKEELAHVNDEPGVSHVGYSIKTKLMGMKVHLLARSRGTPSLLWDGSVFGYRM